MKKAAIIFPHQLFLNNPAVQSGRKVFLIEEFLFFTNYSFHKQKILFHRASMKSYQAHLAGKNIQAEYIDAQNKLSDIRKLIPFLSQSGIKELHYAETTDDWLEERIKRAAADSNINIFVYNSPMFLNSIDELKDFFGEEEKHRQTKFYIRERKRRKILVDDKNRPEGGKWTYDSENRRKYPKEKTPPSIHFPEKNKFFNEAVEYTQKYFGDNPGLCDQSFRYPISFEESRKWLRQFLEQRFMEFGPYEDAIVQNSNILNHSLLSPLLNTGLLTPQEVIEESIDYYKENSIPINSCEGFIRQLIGWREFIRGIYLYRGREQRTRNFWNFSNKIPLSFYEGKTGIEPVDSVIKKVLKTGYCHHIERLMILGNFMLLCEFHPDEVYRWFMEMFIDSYDWVMVPNVYGMSQFADGGLMATKPYISGSNYILKMSDFKRGKWQDVWDGLFWRFMHVHRNFFLKNPRLSLLIRTFDKMPVEKREKLLKNGEDFLRSISQA